jgi:prepilin-type N-terminal cleavage/methylation domain-containing protein
VRRSKGAFTLIEIMIVVLLIGILIAIAVPNYTHARGTSRLRAIVKNLKEIDYAKYTWAMDANQSADAPVLQSNLDGTGGTGSSYLLWPSGPVPGSYAVTTVDADTTFNGGTKGAMNWAQWQATCSVDPLSCGL